MVDKTTIDAERNIDLMSLSPGHRRQGRNKTHRIWRTLYKQSSILAQSM
jgi:hypothetical protein